VLPDERDYTRALSLSRLAYDTESLVSPMLAAALLAVIDFHWLFAATAIGFGASAALVLSTVLPVAVPGPASGSLYGRITRGARIYLATPRLRGLLALNLAAAAGGAMVIVNTVIYVRAAMGRPEADVAVALGAFGAGSMAAALLLPPLLDRLADRPVMIAGGAALTAVLATAGVASLGGPMAWPVLLGIWAAMGLGYSAVLTPSGRLLRRSAHAPDLPAIFAAQFALSHACWLVTYPLSGWLGKAIGLGPTMLVLTGIAALGVMAAARFWPAGLPDELAHSHADLPPDHPHLAGASHAGGGPTHAHAYVIDDLHRRWPG
jgi:predicted MFS family arabinose efflux permease